ncbi:MAG: hypothetical protein HN509_08420 [Halobacteriovoraceae bacterium]|nr:hypothetical protein [Halobacteriovoraceae bacterium]MBT5095706.1 hypothetical protein [Halobacteriovoraceae bacterium]
MKAIFCIILAVLAWMGFYLEGDFFLEDHTYYRVHLFNHLQAGGNWPEFFVSTSLPYHFTDLFFLYWLNQFFDFFSEKSSLLATYFQGAFYMGLFWYSYCYFLKIKKFPLLYSIALPLCILICAPLLSLVAIQVDDNMSFYFTLPWMLLLAEKWFSTEDWKPTDIKTDLIWGVLAGLFLSINLFFVLFFFPVAFWGIYFLYLRKWAAFKRILLFVSTALISYSALLYLIVGQFIEKSFSFAAIKSAPIWLIFSRALTLTGNYDWNNSSGILNTDFSDVLNLVSVGLNKGFFSHGIEPLQWLFWSAVAFSVAALLYNFYSRSIAGAKIYFTLVLAGLGGAVFYEPMIPQRWDFFFLASTLLIIQSYSKLNSLGKKAILILLGVQLFNGIFANMNPYNIPPDRLKNFYTQLGLFRYQAERLERSRPAQLIRSFDDVYLDPYIQARFPQLSSKIYYRGEFEGRNITMQSPLSFFARGEYSWPEFLAANGTFDFFNFSPDRKELWVTVKD